MRSLHKTYSIALPITQEVVAKNVITETLLIMGLNNNLREWREDAKLSREQLAEMVGTSAVSIFRIEKFEQQPRSKLLSAICRVLNKRPGDFYQVVSNVQPAEIGTRRVPVFDFLQTGDVMAIQPRRGTLEETTILTTLDPSTRTFAVRISGRSMEPLFVEGDIVLIDPEVVPRPEDFVFASDELGEDTFKKFHDVGIDHNGKAMFELVSLNPAYPSWRSDRKTITVKGTMLEHRRFRR